MRRKDREVTDFNRILEIIDECPIIHLGLADGDYPYVVTVNFAYEVEGEQVCFYIHGAKAGRKYELMQKNRKCSFFMEMNDGIKVMPEKKDCTTIYRSVSGKAEIEFMDGDDAFRAAEIVMKRYPETAEAPYNLTSIPHTCFARLKVIELAAKANPGNPDLA